MAWKPSWICWPSSSSKRLMPMPSAAADGLELLARGAETPDELYDDPPDRVPTKVTYSTSTPSNQPRALQYVTWHSALQSRVLPFQSGAVRVHHALDHRRALSLLHRDRRQNHRHAMDARDRCAQTRRVATCLLLSQHSPAVLLASPRTAPRSRNVASRLSARTVIAHAKASTLA